MPKITVDGRTIDCKDRTNILQACLDAGVEAPYYCYHPGLSVVASCRICLCEVEGIPKLVPSCQTQVRDGMVVHFDSTKAVANQKQTMEYLLINHPLDCPVCLIVIDPRGDRHAPGRILRARAAGRAVGQDDMSPSRRPRALAVSVW